VKGNKTPASQTAMPIPIIIAILIALFTLGATMNKPAGKPDEVVILGGKQYNWVDKKDNQNTLVVMAPEQQNHTVTIQGQREPAFFDNIFSVFRLISDQKESAHMTAINNSINSNIKQAIALSVKE
jgi:hypothetical protein